VKLRVLHGHIKPSHKCFGKGMASAMPLSAAKNAGFSLQGERTAASHLAGLVDQLQQAVAKRSI